MSFISYAFVGLYLVALLVRWGLPQLLKNSGQAQGRVQVTALLVLSWLFYAWHVPWYILLILASTLVDYLAARRISAAPDRPVQRRAILAVSLITNLGLLGYFKYAGLLVTTANAVAHGGWSVPDILLPIGISFYTFQSMSYTVDVYRGHIEPERDFLRLACYIAFFPQLVAGPIVRAADFLYQLDRRRHFHAQVFAEGAYLILRGLFLKMVLADNLGTIIDQHWALASTEGQGALALALLVFFACQLFCDFAGYVDIARGVAYQLGFRLPVNFNAPYIATSFSGFWRRWHITLSQWMRDYLYLPLGGNRKGRGRVYVNLLLVMLISGLWHGANWTFVAWGGLLGLALAIERIFGLARAGKSLPVTLGWFVVVQLTWILSMGLFRSAEIGEGRVLMENALSGLLTVPAYPGTEGMIVLGWWLTLPVWLLHGRTWLAERSWPGPPGPRERAIYAGAMLAALIMLYNRSAQFIYFQF
jgi:alginate O-acetyltransferase complex protein AlgI